MTSRSWIRGIGVSAAVVLAACGGGEAGKENSSTTVPASTGPTAPTEQSDLEAFLDDNEVESRTISKILETSKLYSTFFEVLSEAELTSLLDGSGPFTVFVPARGAFTSLP
ncbi:MAG: fasciclin domain-containing protein, partial [Actinomycetota bacterium]